MKTYTELKKEIQTLYSSTKAPWIVGFSGGKDSTTVLQLIFYALSDLPKEKLSKSIHVICNDTLVENPIIMKQINQQLHLIKQAGKNNLFSHNPDLFCVEKTKPRLEDTFWVNLIAKGYPSPNRWFRWCTERLKINPTNNYIATLVKNQRSHVLIVLGTRKAESVNRKTAMCKYEKKGTVLQKHPKSKMYIYSPIAEWANNDVWAYLIQAPNPWGSNNRDLLKMYRNACQGGECPFVIETGTQSCGKSRFGCWVCTVIDRDITMENYIDNGEVWMKDLLHFRNWLYKIRQQDYQYVPNRLKSNGIKFGPFLIKTRTKILKKLIAMQEKLKIQLIANNHIIFIEEYLKNESLSKESDKLNRYVYKLANGKKISAISDFDLYQTPRQRLGPIRLNKAEILSTKTVTSKYLKSTRVMYYEMHNTGST